MGSRSTGQRGEGRKEGNTTEYSQYLGVQYRGTVSMIAEHWVSYVVSTLSTVLHRPGSPPPCSSFHFMEMGLWFIISCRREHGSGAGGTLILRLAPHLRPPRLLGAWTGVVLHKSSGG
jgi:hypothetical protein